MMLLTFFVGCSVVGLDVGLLVGFDVGLLVGFEVGYNGIGASHVRFVYVSKIR
jgi:hypothetical protein